VNSIGGCRVAVVIPAYNEERFIGSIVLKAQEFADDVIVVDDGSTDETGEVARAAGAILVRHGRNKGKGEALNTGFGKARELEADILVTLDADGQHLPQELTSVMAPIEAGAADIAIGSRYLKETSDVPRHRVWGHKLFNLVTNQASGTAVTDSQSGFRAFSRPAIDAITFCSDGFSVESEMQFIAREQKLKLVEVPITIQYPDKPKRSVISHGLMVLNGILRLVGQYRPLLFFGVTGLILMLVGTAWGAWVVDIYSRSRTLAIGYALISVILVIIGSISFSTGIILHSTRALLLDLFRSRDSHN
jgi:glycosyltransferase involved in cell wall biosynthesis